MLAFNINNADRVLHTIDEIKMECKVYEIFKTDIYIKWFDKIAKKDRKLAHIIDTRLLRLELDNWGDFKKIDGDLFEMRIHYGAGIRIYFYKKGDKIIILVTGGDKSSQNKDIEKAKEIIKELNKGD